MASTLGLASTSVDLARHVGHKVIVKGVAGDTMGGMAHVHGEVDQDGRVVVLVGDRVVTVGLLVRLEAKRGKEDEVAQLLRDGLSLRARRASDSCLVCHPHCAGDLRDLRRVSGRGRPPGASGWKTRRGAHRARRGATGPTSVDRAGRRVGRKVVGLIRPQPLQVAT